MNSELGLACLQASEVSLLNLVLAEVGGDVVRLKRMLAESGSK